VLSDLILRTYLEKIMNECHFAGNITHELMLNHVGVNKTPVLNFSIAITRKYKKSNGEQAKETVFLPLEVWDSGAETINRHFRKGDSIIVHCSVKTNDYTDKDGNERKGLFKFRVNKFDFPATRRSRDEETTEVDQNPGGFNGDPDDSTPF
jgi:single stranded DNA-binding protein